MRIIEAELHQILDEISPYSSEDEQARIIATAAAIYEHEATRTKVASTNANSVRSAMLADALLKAIGSLEDWASESSKYAPAFIDGRGLNNNKIISQASNMSIANNVWGEMDILNDDIEQLLSKGDEEVEDDESYALNDGHPEHDPATFFAPGRGHHRSDSQRRQ